jgi:two-component system LytT family response regulator
LQPYVYFCSSIQKTNIQMETKRLTALIVEDEQAQQEVLIKMLEKNHPEIMIAGCCHSGADALSTLRTIKPDLIFMDIDLGDMTAFDLLNNLSNPPFQLIFTTAHNAYALQAFKVHAVDFLLKPIDPSELARAVEKTLKQNGNINNLQLLVNDFRMIKSRYLKIDEENVITFLPFDEILFVVRRGSGTEFQLQHQKQRKTRISQQVFETFELELAASNFIRIHNDILVNPTQLKSYNTKSRMLELQCGETLEVDPERSWLLEW